MPNEPTSRTQEQLVAENEELRARLKETEETLRAIRSGEVDALIVSSVGGEQVFTLKGADYSYRILIEDMSEGALTLTAEGVILYANRRLAEMLKTPLEKVIGSTIHTWIAPDSQRILQSLLRQGVGEKRRGELLLAASDGTWVPVYLSVSNLLINEMPDSFCLVATDLAEQKRSDAASENSARERLAASDQSRLALLSVIEDEKRVEEALRESERELKEAQSLGRLGSWSYDLESQTNTWSDEVYQLYERDPVLGPPTPEEEAAYYSPEQLQILHEYSARAFKEEKDLAFDLEVNLPTGKHLFLSAKIEPVKDATGRVVKHFGTIQDVTERKQAAEALRNSREELYRLLNSITESAYGVDINGNCTFVNRAFLQIMGYQNDHELLGKHIHELIHHSHFDGSPYPSSECRIYRVHQTNQTIHVTDEVFWRKDGVAIPVEYWSHPIVKDGIVLGSITTFVDITDRKWTEEELKKSEDKFRTIFDNASDGMFMVDLKTRKFFMCNTMCAKMLGYAQDEFLNLNITDIHPAEYLPFIIEQIGKFSRGEEGIRSDIKFKRKNGSVFAADLNPTLLTIGEKGYLLLSIRDVTERKQAEEALRENEQRLATLMSNLPGFVYRCANDRNWTTIFFSEGCRDITGYAPEDFLQNKKLAYNDIIRQDYRERLWLKWQTCLENKIAFEEEYPIITAQGETRWLWERGRGIFSEDGRLLYLEGFITDITARKRAEEKIRRQLEHLTALSTIDRFVSGNFDLKLSLSEILTQTTIELGVDAADILILNTISQMLEFGAERGFRTKAIRKAYVHLGESYTGRTALERQLVKIPNLREEPPNSFFTTFLAGEDFVCYYGVPLIAKGQVKGVLEVYHRSALNPDTEWFDFLNALSGQTAIAIEDATLFESLQRSNSELFVAYDATIEGWSHALDLRDKETEGHTQRVTEITVNMARTFGLGDDELVQVRWGALLHDIGKMGVPDEILLKPGPLTDEEWVTMKKHPTYAYEMLAPIRYLHAALDIPYCHHEKWDGTGYPVGLKGEQIPLTARIFAVVDVWDALSSDRPYRKAWPKEKVRQHIQAGAGTHFDPEVVRIFLLE